MTGGSRRDDDSTPRRVSRPGTGGGKKGDKSISDGCDISFTANVDGIHKAVLESLSVGEQLSVELIPKGKFTSVVCSAKTGILGSLAAFPRLAALISCIQTGHVYKATVDEIKRGSCKVTVRRVATP